MPPREQPVLPPLATAADLVARLGRTFTDTESERARVLLADASALVRRHTRQHLSYVEHDRVVLRPVDEQLRLPQRPIHTVAEVVAVSSPPAVDLPVTGWSFDGRETVQLECARLQLSLPAGRLEEVCAYPGTYRVTYSHGYQPVPDDIVGVVCAVVARTLTAPAAAAGVISETIGAYSYRLTDTAAAGASVGVQLLSADTDALRPYRRTIGTAIVRP